MVGRALIFLVLCIAAQAETVRDHIVRHEGYSHRAYNDRGHLAIGIGHRFVRGERRVSHWTTAQIEKAFERDLAIARKGAERAVLNLSSHPQNVQTIVIALAFNVGNTGLARFTLFRRALDRHDYQSAAYHLHMSLWTRQLPERSAEYVAVLNAYPARQFVLPMYPAP